jgi:RNA polymerase sigma-70 factor (ECF subfamily)
MIQSVARRIKGRKFTNSLAHDLELAGLGNQAALRRVYDATSPRIYAICSCIFPSRDGVEDVLKDVYVEVWRRAGSFDRKQTNPLAWLTSIARNSAIDSYRAHTTYTGRELAAGDDVPHHGQLTDEELSVKENEGHALSLLADLEDLKEEDVSDIYRKGLSYAHLATQFGVPLPTIKSRVRRTIISLTRHWHDRENSQPRLF